jgi:hypothetical protein
VKTLKSFLCETLRVNITADAIAFTKAGRTSFAGCGNRMRRPRHEQSLRKSRLRPSLRVNPMELAFRAVLFGQVDRPKVLTISSQHIESGDLLVAVKDTGTGIDPAAATLAEARRNATTPNREDTPPGV